MLNNVAIGWERPPATLSLTETEVHIWRIPLSGDDEQVDALKALLSSEEISRADRFHFARDRSAYIIAHAALRSILARYAQRDPLSLDLRPGPFGKPALSGDPGGLRLRFNLSHSGEVALLAVARNREVGIDVERLRAGIETGEIAARFFSPAEVSELETVPPHVRERAFFRVWTSKEAYIKARGEGLSFPLAEFDVEVWPDRPISLRATTRDPQEARRWKLAEVKLDDQYVAAIAVEGDAWRLRGWHWLPPGPAQIPYGTGVRRHVNE